MLVSTGTLTAAPGAAWVWWDPDCSLRILDVMERVVRQAGSHAEYLGTYLDIDMHTFQPLYRCSNSTSGFQSMSPHRYRPT
jgi:hypothetical protein